MENTENLILLDYFIFGLFIALVIVLIAITIYLLYNGIMVLIEWYRNRYDKIRFYENVYIYPDLRMKQLYKARDKLENLGYEYDYKNKEWRLKGYGLKDI